MVKSSFKRLGIFILASLIIFVVFSLLIYKGILSAYYERILILICINIVLALSLNLILGFTGQFTLGHSGFMSIGAYTSAMITIKLNLPFPLALLSGGILAAIIGFLIGIPTLKLKGDYLAITTLGFCQIIVVIIQNIPQIGGAQGLTGIPGKTNFAWAFFIMIASIIVIYNIVHSSQGRAMISVREDEIAAEAMGINTTKYKIMAFVVGAFLAGIAGGVYSHYMMYIEPQSFNFLKSTDFVVYVVLGGIGNIPGCILSTIVLTYLPEGLRGFGDLRMVIYPILLIVIMILNAKGMSPSKLLRRKSKRGNYNATA
ncbi:branched-chain amino acid ABC transporter permease [Clostridium guangxiense]|uniref:branched-chain amino acid ABC transporter permease n=1 Tax=Clostridium guangxiense TaxID=1662055 RepID=UPI001E600C61|nr:branched-chain amino acid ABC transporter permease [Clostridium guangxiense]MCD2345128.1 branched-chain amino acid ABC transporter permease [Clostridium guangxiense]